MLMKSKKDPRVFIISKVFQVDASQFFLSAAMSATMPATLLATMPAPMSATMPATLSATMCNNMSDKKKNEKGQVYQKSMGKCVKI